MRRVEDIHGVGDIVAVSGVRQLDAVPAGRGVVEATADDLAVAVPSRPPGNRMMEEHHSFPVGEQSLERLAIPSRRVGPHGSATRSVEHDTWHVVHHEHVELGGTPGIDEFGRLGMLDVFPLDIVERVEHGEERVRVERMPLRYHRDAGHQLTRSAGRSGCPESRRPSPRTSQGGAPHRDSPHRCAGGCRRSTLGGSAGSGSSRWLRSCRRRR